MAAFAGIDKATPAAGTALGLGDDQIRALKLFLQEVFGIPDATTITNEAMNIAADGQITINDTGADIDFRVEGSGDANLTYWDAGNDRVGIGIATPDGRLHVHTASAGSITADTDADDLVVENSGDVGMTFLGGTTSNCRINMGDSGDANIGIIDYDNNTNQLEFTAGTKLYLVLRDNSTDFVTHVNKGAAAVADAGLEVSDGITVGAGGIHRASSAAPSMPHMKTITRTR